MSTIRCLIDPATCTWGYTADRQVFVDAAWRIHYGDHARGKAALEQYTRAGTAHPVVRPRPGSSRYIDRADHNQTHGRETPPHE